MPIEYSDTGRAETDISGVPPQVTTPRDTLKEARRSANQNERRPQAQKPQKPKDSNPVGDMFSGLGSAAHGAEQNVGNALGGAAGQARKLVPPVLDFGQEVNRAPGDVWGLARNGYQTLSGAWVGGIHDLFAQQDAAHRLGAQVAGFAADSIPFVGLGESFSNLQSLEQEREGKITDEQRKQQMAGNEEQAVIGAPGQALQDVAGGPLGGAGGAAERVAAGVGMSGIGVIDDLMSNDPNRVNSGLLWLGVGSVLSGFHVPTSVRKALVSRIGDWPLVERWLGDATRAKQTANAAVTDPKAAHEAASAYVAAKVGGDATTAAHAAQAPVESQWQYTTDHMPGEPVPRDPRLPLGQLSGPQKDLAHTSLRALNGVIEDVRSGLWADHEHGSEAETILRATAGLDRSVGASFDEWYQSVGELLKDATPETRVEMMKAAEGDTAAYDALKPAERLVVDSWTQIRSELRQASKGTDYADNFVAGWVPRLDEIPAEVRRVGRPSAAQLARENRRHRAVEDAIDPVTGKAQLKYKTVQDANADIKRGRQAMQENLLDTATALRTDVAGDPEAREIRKLAITNPEEAAARAARMAADHFPLKSEDFLTAIRAARYQARAIASHRGMNELTQTVLNTTHPDGSNMIRTAVAKAQPGTREAERLMNSGYEPIADPKFRGFYVDREFNKTFSRYLNRDFGVGSGAIEKIAQLERRLVRLTMFSPMLHGLNVMRRKAYAAEMHPLLFAAYTKAMHGTPEEVDALRRQARRAGVMPPRAAQNYRNQFADSMDSAFGHSGFDVSEKAPDGGTKLGTLLTAIEKKAQPYAAMEERFWKWVSDFGHQMYHIEHDAARAAGVPEEKATAYAARRANSWMGTVLPEDSNPLIQKLARVAFFSPNWWRSEAELLTNAYMRSGIYKDKSTALYAATEAVKSAGAQYALAHLAGNALNYAMSGHLQSGNQQGRQNDIEITNPGVLRALQAVDLLPQGVDVNTGINSKTGARVTMRNPFGGQWEDIEGALGFQSGYAGTRVGPDFHVGPVDAQVSLPGSGSDVANGAWKFLAGRVSPFVNAGAALANVDLYHSLTDRQMAPEVPGTDPLVPSPASFAAAAFMSLPGGMNFAAAQQRNIDQGGQDTTSVLGTQVPSTLQGWIEPFKEWGARTALSGLLGVNAPYATAERTRGTLLSDADYQKVKEVQGQYDKQQAVASGELFSGQMRPDQWLNQYRDANSQHGAQMRALFKNAPEYTGGAVGLVNQWEQLYTDATAPNGTIDQGKLAALQAQFSAQHSPAEMAQMRSQLSANTAKNPAAALYYKTVDSYDAWQQQWAQQHGVDVVKLRTEVSQYNSLYGDSAAQRHYLQQHHELSQFDHDIRFGFDRSLMGMMYALFHGQHTTILRMLKARGMTEQQLEEDIAA